MILWYEECVDLHFSYNILQTLIRLIHWFKRKALSFCHFLSLFINN
uniref:Uncharacterized protein n=1 Tax=Rhizophora mucronata TaxID=61149 RepID=A0A2P2PR42_RHIMU